MSLLSVLVGIWLNSVYKEEVRSLQNQTNIIFLKALENVEKNMVLKRSLPAKLNIGLEKGIVKWPNKGRSIPNKYEGMIVIKMRSDSLKEHSAFKIKDLLNYTHTKKDTSSKITISINATTSEINIGNKGTFVLDIDSARTQLIDFFSLGLSDTHLDDLQYKILKKGLNSNFQASFITDVGKLGNVFIDGGDFLAAIDYHRWMILKKMLPEMLFSLFLFFATGGAFSIILSSLRKEKRLAAMKDDFVSNMTHELKTPISVVNVAIESLSDFDVLKNKEKSQEYISISKRELLKLDELVDRILTVNSTKSDPHFTSPKPIIINLEIVNAITEFGVLSTRIRKQLTGEPLKVKMSKEHFKSVIKNIIDNGLKYGAKDGQISVTTQKKNDQCIITITNDGNEIPKVYSQRVFEKFYRIPTANIHDVKGHGLGLYYTHKHIKDCDGEIIVESNAGQCSFIINLPLIP